MKLSAKVVYENHWNFGIQVADTLRLIKLSLEAAGVRADIEKELVPGALNVVIESFSDEFADKLLALIDAGTPVLLVATEYLTGSTFNEFERPGDTAPDKHYDNQQYWAARCRNFWRVANRADAIWHLQGHQVDAYRERANCAVGYLPHTYNAGFRSVRMRPEPERDIDFLFTGTITPYRRAVLDALASLGHRVVVTPILTAHFHRDDLVARSKVCLALRQHPGWLFSSPSRLYYHLSNESLLISERCDFACELDCHVTQSKSIVDDACRLLMEGDHALRAKAALDDFANARPMAPIASMLLSETLPSYLLEQLLPGKCQ